MPTDSLSSTLKAYFRRRRHVLPSMSMKSSADKGLIHLGVQMVPDVQTGYESKWFQSFQTFQSFKNRTLMTGDFRVQTNRDELSRFIGDSRPARGRESRPGHLFLETVERLGVALQNLVGLGIADPALVRPAADFVQRAQVGGDVGVAVVGADHQVIFSSELQ